MNAIQDVREAKAMWDREFAGKREPVNLSGSWRGGLLAKLHEWATTAFPTAVVVRPAYGR